MSTEVKAAQAKADQGKAAKAQTMADIIAAKKPNTRTIDIVLDTDLANEIKLKEQELGQAKSRRRDLAHGVGPIEVELDELYERAADIAVTFTFQDMGRKPFDDLILAHPPTSQQKQHIADLGGGVLEYNIDTFPPALLAATAIDPVMTVEEAETIFNEWGSGEAELLFSVALMVCKERASVPLSRSGTEPTQDST